MRKLCCDSLVIYAFWQRINCSFSSNAINSQCLNDFLFLYLFNLKALKSQINIQQHKLHRPRANAFFFFSIHISKSTKFIVFSPFPLRAAKHQSTAKPKGKLCNSISDATIAPLPETKHGDFLTLTFSLSHFYDDFRFLLFESNLFYVITHRAIHERTSERRKTN